MFCSGKKIESTISVDLEEPLTGHACSQLVIELVKYIMYQKQQIPLACDSLMKLHANSKPTDRNYLSMQNLLDCLRNVSDHLSLQFRLADCNVKEIVIVIGATIATPKICVRVQLPEQVLNSQVHMEYQHSYRKPLLNVLKSILECEEFQNEMSVPLGLTNTFLLVQKSDSHSVSEFFLPKPQFNILSQKTACFNIHLNYSEVNKHQCNCEKVTSIYNDSLMHHERNISLEESSSKSLNAPYQWYQSKDIFRGFKFHK